MERGEFDDLPHSGRPLSLDDDASVPEDLRLAFKILKNAGCLPPELELKKEIHSLGELIRTIGDGDERSRKERLLEWKILKLNMMRRKPLNLEAHPVYARKVRERLLK